MKVTLEALKTAICSFMDSDIISKAPQNKRFLFGAVTMMLPHIVDDKYHELMPYLKTMELVCDDGMIDIDKAEMEIVKIMDKYGSYSITMLGATISLNQADVHHLAELARMV